MIPPALEALFNTTCTAANIFIGDPSGSNGLHLDEKLTDIIRATSSIDPTGRLNPSDSQLLQLLGVTSNLLTYSRTSASTRSKLHLMLFNLALYNVPVRRFMSGSQELRFCHGIFHGLCISLEQQLGPQNLIDILRLLQVLTYEKSLTLGRWTNELISFLIKEINNLEEPEWLPYCMTILTNLVLRSKTVVEKIRNSSSFKQFNKRLLKLLTHDTRTVVVCSLVLIGYLDEKIRDTVGVGAKVKVKGVYCHQNIHQTFLCLFNVLAMSSDSLMTIHIAADLIKRLVISESNSVSSTPTITSTASDLVNYTFFVKSIQQVATLLVTLDNRSEEALKVYQLLLAFCRLSQLKSQTCQAILKTPPAERRLTTPVLAMCRAASMSFEEALDPEVPLVACRSLDYMLREAIESSNRVQNYVPAESILNLIDTNVKTSVETKSDLVTYQCRRITEGLRLAETISNDEELRTDLLEIVTAPLCAHINESQLISNPVVNFMNRPPSQRASYDLPQWSSYGVSIPLQLLKLLATLKDYSKPHKELYWKSLKDERLIPFLAFSIAHGEGQTVYDALVLYTHCSQVQEYRSRWLSDLIASCASYKLQVTHENGNSHSSQNGINSRSSSSSQDPIIDLGYLAQVPSINGDDRKLIDETLQKLVVSIDQTKEPRLSQVVHAFQRKLIILESRERELEQLVAIKEKALTQSEKLRATYRSQENNCNEVNSLRMLVDDLEKKLAESHTEMLALKSEKTSVMDQMKTYKQACDSKQLLLDNANQRVMELQRENAIMNEENEKDRQLLVTTRGHFDDMKLKFENASKTLLSKQEETVQLARNLEITTKQFQDAQKQVNHLEMTVKNCDAQWRNSNDEVKRLRLENESYKEEIAKLKAFKQKMQKMLSQDD